MKPLALLRMEQIKAKRHTPFIAALAVFIFMTLIVFGGGALMARGATSAESVGLPAAALPIHVLLQPFVMFFSFVTVVNQTATEYQWRTARQNVIDGLSRDEFFVAKLLLVPVISLLYYIIGYGLALPIAATGGVSGGIVQVPVLKAMAGALITTIGVSSMALLASFGTRHTAGSIALVLGYIMFGEGALATMLRRSGDVLAEVAPYLPWNVFRTLASVGQYTGQAGMFPMAGAAEPLPTAALLLAGVMYIAGFAGASYAIVRKQDL